jgi:lipid A 4'-phosphatase
MNRTGLFIALGIAVAVGLPFAFRPSLDLDIASLFNHVDQAGHSFPRRYDLMFQALRDSGLYISYIFVAAPLIAIVVKLFRPDKPMLIRGRAVFLLLSALILGPGLVTNALFKENWNRVRPIDVHEFAGAEGFRPWWDPRGTCDRNCSFVCGDCSMAFWTLAPAAVAPLPYRPIAYAAALTLGTTVGFLRMTFGAHFFTDVIFAGVFTFLVIWLLYALIYRWARTRITDADIETVLERFAGFLHGRTALDRPVERRPDPPHS